MCGKFTAMKSWREIVEYSRAFSTSAADEPVTLRVTSNIPLIVFDRESGARRVVPMRWGFPHPKDWRRPQPIHARSEGIETTRAFASAFFDGQRGIALVKTFNEAPDVEGPTIQHTITPDTAALGIAFVWRRFDVEGIPAPMLACCMVTVPANELIATLPTDRMPAVLNPEDWGKWLGEEPTSVDELKACLKTREGVRWTMTREERKANPNTKREKPVVSDPGGLL
jgi:putative SOS response-associated peptidase YedK